MNHQTAINVLYSERDKWLQLAIKAAEELGATKTQAAILEQRMHEYNQGVAEIDETLKALNGHAPAQG